MILTLALVLAGTFGGFTSITSEAAQNTTRTTITYVRKNHWVKSNKFVNTCYHCVGKHKIVKTVRTDYSSRKRYTVVKTYSHTGRLENTSTNVIKIK